MPQLTRVRKAALWTAGLALVAGAVTQTALAAGPPAGVNYTATMSFTLKADQPDVTCFLHAKPGALPASCKSGGQFGSVLTAENLNSIWFQPKAYYAVPTGSLTYEAKGHPTQTVTWFGGHRALSRTFGNVAYHVTMGHIEVLKAYVPKTTSASTANFTAAPLVSASAKAPYWNVQLVFNHDLSTGKNSFFYEHWYNGSWHVCKKAACGYGRYVLNIDATVQLHKLWNERLNTTTNTSAPHRSYKQYWCGKPKILYPTYYGGKAVESYHSTKYHCEFYLEKVVSWLHLS